MSGTAPVRLERIEDAAVWDGLVDTLTPAPAFHRPTWLDLQARLNDIVIERLLVLEDDRPVGVLPVARRSRHSIEGVDSPFPYLGPLVPPRLLGSTAVALRAWQRRTGLVISHLSMGPMVSVGAVEAFEEAGLQAHEDSTVVIDLSHRSLEAMRAGYSSLRRRDIRRAARDGATVREALPGELTTLLPQALDEAFAAHGKPSPYPASVGAEVERWARGRDDVGVFTALVHDEPAGVQVVLGGGEVALAWAGAALRRFRDANPNVLLYDRLLQWALETGHTAVDLCGRVDEGVLKYKLAFGGVERPYAVARATLVPQRLLSAAAGARRLLRR